MPPESDPWPRAPREGMNYSHEEEQLDGINVRRIPFLLTLEIGDAYCEGVCYQTFHGISTPCGARSTVTRSRPGRVCREFVGLTSGKAMVYCGDCFS